MTSYPKLVKWDQIEHPYACLGSFLDLSEAPTKNNGTEIK